MNILDEAFPSATSDSTKENKSQNHKFRPSKEKERERDLVGYKSQPRDQPSYPISFNKSQ